jgi:hypothetical protein
MAADDIVGGKREITLRAMMRRVRKGRGREGKEGYTRAIVNDGNRVCLPTREMYIERDRECVRGRRGEQERAWSLSFLSTDFPPPQFSYE